MLSAEATGGHSGWGEPWPGILAEPVYGGGRPAVWRLENSSSRQLGQFGVPESSLLGSLTAHTPPRFHKPWARRTMWQFSPTGQTSTANPALALNEREFRPFDYPASTCSSKGTSRRRGRWHITRSRPSVGCRTAPSRRPLRPTRCNSPRKQRSSRHSPQDSS